MLGAYNYFLLKQTTVGKQMLLEATKEGDTNTQYGWAIALLCEFDDNRKEILLFIFTSIRERHLYEENYVHHKPI